MMFDIPFASEPIQSSQSTWTSNDDYWDEWLSNHSAQSFSSASTSPFQSTSPSSSASFHGLSFDELDDTDAAQAFVADIGSINPEHIMTTEQGSDPQAQYYSLPDSTLPSCTLSSDFTFHGEGFGCTSPDDEQQLTASLTTQQSPEKKPRPRKPRDAMFPTQRVIEARYRTKLNDKIVQLQRAVPTIRVMIDGQKDSDELRGLEPARNLKKGTVLAKTIEYISKLEKDNEDLTRRLRQLETSIGEVVKCLA